VTRRAQRAAWFPLLVFGLLTLVATPLYREPTGASRTTHLLRGPLSFFAGGLMLRNPAALSLYWLTALIVGYVATVVFFRWRASRDGVVTSVWPYVGTGLALMLLLAFLSAIPFLPGDAALRGLTPVLTIAVGLFVLAWAQRSAGVWIFACLFFAVAMTADLYNMSNLFARIGITVPDAAINVVICGCVLLIGGAILLVASRRVA